ncbi:hypothetical protein PVAND_017336 [Polypedilum vanderplanki]|uniref:Uncharacterized protein n=1 Tax=Polypedilum vanderplanki TaxID=319348 RepID=A0A9J6BHS9_POLVA|nr:hypothetical protein PVAND_017336 [Polypedilum vanderplanki]
MCLKKFCCCCQLETGGYMIAIIGIFANLFDIFSSIQTVDEFGFFSVIFLIFCIILLIGVKIRSCFCILLFFIGQIFSFGLDIIKILGIKQKLSYYDYNDYFYSKLRSPSGDTLITLVIVIIINIYILLVLYTLFVKFKNNSTTEQVLPLQATPNQ